MGLRTRPGLGSVLYRGQHHPATGKGGLARVEPSHTLDSPVSKLAVRAVSAKGHPENPAVTSDGKPRLFCLVVFLHLPTLSPARQQGKV